MYSWKALILPPEAICPANRVALGFGSDSSYRFERGVDYAATRDALERATELVIGSAAVCPARWRGACQLAAENARRSACQPSGACHRREIRGCPRVGDAAEPRHALRAEWATRLLVTPPSYRFDIAIEVTFDRRDRPFVWLRQRAGACTTGSRPDAANRRTAQTSGGIDAVLVARDYQQVINYAFVDTAWETGLLGNTDPVRLQNPIASQMSVMRSSLIGGLLANLQHNLNRRHERVRLFGWDAYSAKAGQGFDQPEKIAGLAFRPANPGNGA